MDRHLTTLEFPKILERLAHYTAFSASQTLALALRPSPYLAEVHGWQTETSEASRLLSVKPNLGIGQADDIRPLAAQARRGFILLATDLLKIRQTLIAARDLQRTISRLAKDYPRLADIAGRIEPCPGLVNEIGNAIDDRGQVKDSASPELARIRRELDIAHGRLMEKLNRIISSTQFSQYLQEALITQRGGRYVVPVKADFKGRIQGVVHDQSASGATIFVEPLTTVELNNRWRKLQLDEADEIQRILAELSGLAGQHERYLNHTVAALAELDLALAKAKFGQALDAVEPILFELTAQPDSHERPPQPTGPGLRLLAARHPLLDPATVVPIDVSLPEGTRMLVITGPNTGGKTVSLKTVGLLAAMAQAGLRIPAAEGSSLPMFNHILADIGDEQSIEQSLSTFSAHMTNIVQILGQCDHRSLVILDELGAGTDPVEGSALARAILTNLLQRQVATFVATHFSELKAFAHATPGVANASMEFDLDSLSPTFRLRLGLPGASNAFAIAQRLGLAGDLIEAARSMVGENSRQVEAMLAEIKAEAEAARAARRQAEAELAEAEAFRRERERQLAEVDAERRQILNSTRADARREIKAVRQEIRELKEKVEAELAELRAAARQIRQAKSVAVPAESEVVDLVEVEAKLDTVVAGLVTEVEPSAPPEPAPTKIKEPVEPGDKVFVPQFGTLGEVVTIQNKQAEVQLGHFRTIVPLAEIELREKGTALAVETRVRVTTPSVESPGFELDLRGQVTEEALHQLDQYLDQAFLARLPWVRIIHGKGSGILRQAVREELRDHPLISSYRPGDEGEGGEGVTVAKLVVN